MKKTFVETRTFTARAERTADGRDAAHPAKRTDGRPREGCRDPRLRRPAKNRAGAGLRGKGKRGGTRVIYLSIPEAERIDLLTVYGKDEKEDLSTFLNPRPLAV